MYYLGSRLPALLPLTDRPTCTDYAGRSLFSYTRTLPHVLNHLSPRNHNRPRHAASGTLYIALRHLRYCPPHRPCGAVRLWLVPVVVECPRQRRQLFLGQVHALHDAGAVLPELDFDFTHSAASRWRCASQTCRSFGASFGRERSEPGHGGDDPPPGPPRYRPDIRRVGNLYQLPSRSATLIRLVTPFTTTTIHESPLADETTGN